MDDHFLADLRYRNDRSAVVWTSDLFEATEQDLLSYSPQEFEGRLQSEIRLQIERAKRLHFPADWTWETTMP